MEFKLRDTGFYAGFVVLGLFLVVIIKEFVKFITTGLTTW
jgi:hypothetical protein